MLPILCDAGFTDLVTTSGFTRIRTALYEKPAKFADYMLIDRPEAVRRFDVVATPVVSDHCPLVLHL